ncbi:MAG: hypothetical protein IJN97_01355 [Oscillospiraceae bacterium]|nr:hypothetical protein [Oscillospiraceae bacterium]
MKRVKRTVYAGAVCEQIVYNVGDNTKNFKNSKPKPRFKTDEERERHNSEIARRHHAQLFNEAFRAGSSLYSTLTFDDEHEVHTWPEARKIREVFIRRLRRRFPTARIMLYIGRGKTTERIHFHMVSEGIPEEVIKKQWTYGGTGRIVTLREHNKYNGVDYGADFTGLANYLFNHWTPEQGGHRYYKTRNIKAPKKERTTVIKRNYSVDKPPRAPKGYKLVERESNEFGYLYFKYVKIPEKHPYFLVSPRK